jgi:hypothetical protein
LSDIVYNWRGIFYAIILIIIWLAAAALVGCSHVQVTNDTPNMGPAAHAKPEPGRF